MLNRERSRETVIYVTQQRLMSTLNFKINVNFVQRFLILIL